MNATKEATMQARLIIFIALVIGVAALLPGVAAAGVLPSKATYMDAAGDDQNGAVADVTHVQVSNTAAGDVTFDVHTPGSDALIAGDSYTIGIDTDRKPSTGNAYGIERAIVIVGDEQLAYYYVWSGSAWTTVKAQTLQWKFDQGPVVTINRSELNGTLDLGFYITATYVGSTSANEYFDYAPDTGAWSYSIPFQADAPVKHTLSVSVDGDGQVTSDPAGVSCAPGCSVQFPAGTKVTLKTAATAGSSFAGWGGDCAPAGTAPTCTVTLDAARNVSVRFAKDASAPAPTPTPTPTPTPAPTPTSPSAMQHTLAISIEGQGAVKSDAPGIACTPSCSAPFAAGTTVTLTASALPGSFFQGWGGACAAFGATPTCTVSMDASKSVIARFLSDPPGGGEEGSKNGGKRPVVRPFASSGKAGAKTKLLYRVSDDGGQTREVIRVLRGKKVLAVIRTTLAETKAGTTYNVIWKAPKLRGTFRFCVKAFDADGQASAERCAPLRLR
ncbi:MAG: hypothetical protein ABR583_05590 [Gaiellaceae bacterium]